MRRSTGIALALLLVLFSACSLGDPDTAVTPDTQVPEPVRYVAIGADETLGTRSTDQRRQAWPRLIFREHLPPQAVIVELARPGATVADALVEQLPTALDAAPTIATVWLGSADAVIGTPTDDYRADLAEFLGALRDTGAQVVVLDEQSAGDRYSSITTAVAGELGLMSVVVSEQSSQSDIAQQVADRFGLTG